MITEQAYRKTYPQNWKAYNAAQTCEKDYFLKLLHSLCATVREPEQTAGRPRLPLNDALFSVCYKIYSTVSGRRFISDLRDAQEKGYIDKAPHFNSLFNYLDNNSLTPILQDLIVKSSLPLQGIEQDFAADSSGFTAAYYDRWYDHKYGQKQLRDWIKVHIMCGVKTNIITAVEIKGPRASDTIQLEDLVNTTNQNFLMREVSGDKAYSSNYNYKLLEAKGITPYIKFKKNTTGRGSDLWAKMFHMFQFNAEEYGAHYHKRSNVESTFSMIKRKFGGNIRSKTQTAMRNECLCKILCHNICVVIQEMHELGIDNWLVNPAQIFPNHNH